MSEMQLFEVGLKERFKGGYFVKVNVIAKDADEAVTKVREWYLQDAEEDDDYLDAEDKRKYLEVVRGLLLARVQHIGVAIV